VSVENFIFDNAKLTKLFKGNLILFPQHGLPADDDSRLYQTQLHMWTLTRP